MTSETHGHRVACGSAKLAQAVCTSAKWTYRHHTGQDARVWDRRGDLRSPG